jgi:hypothetical protein
MGQRLAVLVWRKRDEKELELTVRYRVDFVFFRRDITLIAPTFT